MVDYFAPIGDYLESIVFEDTTDWLIRDVCWSYKTKYHNQLRLYDAYGTELKSLGGYGLQRFRRLPGFPPRVFFWRTLTPKQLSLLLAVGATLED
jgi:hypothetical protein